MVAELPGRYDPAPDEPTNRTSRPSHSDGETGSHRSLASYIKHVLNFYKDRFDIDMNGSQRDDLEAFLLAL